VKREKKTTKRNAAPKAKAKELKPAEKAASPKKVAKATKAVKKPKAAVVKSAAAKPKRKEKVSAAEKKKVVGVPVPSVTAAVPPQVKSKEPKATEPAPEMAKAVKEKEKPATESVAKRKSIKVEMPSTVGDLARKLNVKIPELIKTLMGFGIFANVNQLLSEEIIYRAGKAFDIDVERVEDEETDAILKDTDEPESELRSRPPVVTLMGHVDHGKTTLLDGFRKSKVAAGEAGQITQHIGAYSIDIEGKGRVTFLDTPGHEAFTAMRARGANVTDVVVLVVAANDGIKPQTIEAIDHARAAACPIVVALNKCDLPTADPQKVMAQLQKIDLVPEEWGGKTICVKVSAKSGEGINDLLEMLLLEAEILELKANPNRLAQGTILEARLTKGQGTVATALVQKGTLRIGDYLVSGSCYGKVRAMKSDRGRTVKEAGPSEAVEILGISGTPEAGEIFTAVQDEKIARKISEKRKLEIREREMQGYQTKHLSLENLYSQVQEGRVKELKLIIKADVQGSAGALTQSLEQLANDQISLRVIHSGVGGINESDIMLAAASNAIALGFHVKPNEKAVALIEKENVDVRLYNIIYEAIEDVRKAMEGLLEPTSKEISEGRVEIQKTFESSRFGTIGGGIVRKGKIARNHLIRVIRENIVVFDGKLSSLKRFKDDAREVQEGYECGIVVQGYDGLQEGDLVEGYRIEKVAAKLK